MKATGIVAAPGLLLAGLCACATLAAQTTTRAPDEPAILDAGAAFVRAYNAGDTRALAAMFTADAEVISEDGQVIEGRDAIAAHFASTFEALPGQTIEIHVESIRFLGPDVAKEEGRARVHPPGANPSGSGPMGVAVPQFGRYTVLYVRQEGRWLQSSVREHVDRQVTPHQQLEPLAWLLGDWVDEGGASVVFSTARWSDDGSFLLREFTLQVAGRPATRGTQRIGWDPLTKQIISWSFDSDGGHGTASWAHDGNRWIVKGSGVVHNGRTTTSTQVYTVVNPHQVRWKAVDRTVGGELEPDLPEFVLVRRPPRPR
jgi:uncharacterized protein (TIGR02246 family)